jgi:hypothetical protein
MLRAVGRLGDGISVADLDAECVSPSQSVSSAAHGNTRVSQELAAAVATRLSEQGVVALPSDAFQDSNENDAAAGNDVWIPGSDYWKPAVSMPM